MDKIDRIRKIISESSAAQERAKMRVQKAKDKQKENLKRNSDKKSILKQQDKLNKLRKSGIAQSIKKAKFSKPNITKVSDEGKTGVTAMGQTVGNVAKAGAAVAKNVVKGALKTAVAVGNVPDRLNRGALKKVKADEKRDKINVLKRKLDLKRVKMKDKVDVMKRKSDAKKVKMKDKKREKLANMIKDNQPKKSLTAKSVREEFIQEVEEKKDKVDKVIDIMRGKNKIQINPEVKESVDKKKI